MVSAQAQDSAGGWNKAKWGMSAEELRASFEGRLIDADKPETVMINGSQAQCLSRLPDVEISGHRYTASFFMNGGKLVGVRIEPVSIATEDALQSMYDSLDSGLVAKYGQPLPGKARGFDVSGWNEELRYTKRLVEAMRNLGVGGGPRVLEELWQLPDTRIYLGASDTFNYKNHAHSLAMVLIYLRVESSNL